MVDVGTPMVAGLVVSRDRGEPGVLRLCGRMNRRGAAELDGAAVEVLGATGGSLVVDVVDLAGDVASVIDVLNGLALRRLTPGQVMVLRVGEADVATLPSERLHASIVVEAMRSTPAGNTPTPVPRVKVAVEAGTLRREGPGFVPSYGTGRSCAEPGCETTLSRYNSRTVCFAHSQPER